MTSCSGTVSLRRLRLGNQFLRKRLRNVVADADDEHSVTCLGHAVLLRVYEEVLRLRPAIPGIGARARREREQTVSIRLASALEFLHHVLKDPLAAMSRREHPLDVFHYRHGRSEPPEHVNVLLVQGLPIILVRVVPDIAGVPGPPYHRVRLARWPSEKHRTSTVFGPQPFDPLPEQVAGSFPAQLHALGLIACLGPLVGVQLPPVRLPGGHTVQEFIVLGRETRPELPKERPQP